jgi:alkylation response protein AidB-like acyl-CoA dehydrogenase
MNAFTFAPPPVLPEAEALRAEVRDFLATELADRPAIRRAESWSGFDPAFSRRMAARGWVGMIFPREYGGHGRSALERYVVLEEMLAAGAPVAGHWIADRQSGPSILRYGTEAQRQFFLPRIARGEFFFCIGMSEPDTGSDLASVRTRAVPVADGYVVDGTKLWTSQAHECHFMILFCRTGSAEDRHGGTSQFLVDLSLPGIAIRPVRALTGEHHFNEVVFDNVKLPAEALLGELGQGWQQVTGELAYERSGPERFLSSFTLLVELVRALGPDPSERAAVALGRLGAHLVTLRRLSRSVAGMLQAGENPALQAAMVKDLGALVEQEIPDIARSLVATDPPSPEIERFLAVLNYTTLHAPSFSLRGGTREILRGIIARGLGLR